MASEVRFTEIRKILEKHGWQLSRTRGSHHVFTGKDRPTIPIPVHRGKVRHEYAKLVQKEIDKLGQQEGLA
ncbi:MAG: type II toxin-antitoxin system HicA family toxin [Phycisphaerales bacterium]